MKRTLLLCLLLFSCAPKPEIPYGEPFLVGERVGQDYLALLSPHFNHVEAADALKEGTPIGILDWTFGTDTSHLEYLNIRVRPNYVRIHLINGPCIRNGNCGRYEPGFGFTKSTFSKALENKNRRLLTHLTERTLLYRHLCVSTSTRCLVSPILEHDVSERAWKNSADAVREAWPEVPLVNSAGPSGWKGNYNSAFEEHGNHPTNRAVINSLDGVDVRDINVRLWHNTPGRKLCWSLSYNCRKEGLFIDPRKRTACPRHFKALRNICENR